MAQKRPLAAPIFNKGKRPRCALLAHPNNHGGISHEAIQQKDKYQYDRSYSNQCQEQHSFTFPQKQVQQRSNLSSLPSSNQFEQPHLYENSWQERSYERGCHQQAGTNTHQQQSYKTTHQQQSHEHNHPVQSYEHNRQPYSHQSKNQAQIYDRRPQSYGSQPLSSINNQDCAAPKNSSSSKLSDQYSLDASPAALGSACAQAQEPTKQSSAQLKKLQPSELRVITATALGIEHWSQYGKHVQLLFEVYGTLDTISATRSDKAAQEFSIKSLDGILQCVYWEMEGRFPAIVQGRPVRVVGGWDVGKKRLKCYSVRPSRTGEEEGLVRQCVTLADRHMRRFVGRI